MHRHTERPATALTRSLRECGVVYERDAEADATAISLSQFTSTDKVGTVYTPLEYLNVAGGGVWEGSRGHSCIAQAGAARRRSPNLPLTRPAYSLISEERHRSRLLNWRSLVRIEDAGELSDPEPVGDPQEKAHRPYEVIQQLRGEKSAN